MGKRQDSAGSLEEMDGGFTSIKICWLFAHKQFPGGGERTGSGGGIDMPHEATSTQG